MGFLDDVFEIFGYDEKKKRKREKKRRMEAERAFEEERQRRIELENQLNRQKEEERQRQIELERQEEERQRQEEERQRQEEVERRRQIISAFADSFTSEILRELTFKRLENAEDDCEELYTIDSEVRHARNIESNANILPMSPYCELIMQRLFDAYNARDIEKLQALMEEAEQIQNLKIIKSCSLSKTLQQLTNERIADADTLGELQRIKKEVLCAYAIKQCYKEHLGGQAYQEVYRKLEDAYQKRNIGALQVLTKKSEQLRDLVQSIKSYSLSEVLQKLTDERIANARINIDELQRIKKEVLCAYKAEQSYRPLHQEVRRRIEVAYQNRNLQELAAIRSESQTESRPIVALESKIKSVLSKFDDWRYDKYGGMGGPGD